MSRNWLYTIATSAAILGSSVLSLPAYAVDINDLFVFGDSYSDTDAYVKLTNGETAVWYLAQEFGITLDTSKNSSAAYLRATFDWHIDGCTPLSEECPQKATLLSAVAVAERGGETEFANSYAAYDDLTDEEKRRFGSLRVVHSLEASQRRITPNPTPEQVQRWRQRRTHEHPLVWTHRSGRKSLVLGASADYILGMDLAEGCALLAELLDRATGPDKVYRHNWSVGDTVIWDNQGVLHRAAPYDPDSPREMLRTTVLGDEPIE